MKKTACLITVLLTAVAISHAQPSEVFVVSPIDKADARGLDIRSQLIKDGDGIIQIGIAGGSMDMEKKISNLTFGIKLARRDKDGGG